MGSRTITNILIKTSESIYSKSFYNQYGCNGKNILSMIDFLPNYKEFLKTLKYDERKIIQNCFKQRQLSRTDLEGSADVYLIVNEEEKNVYGIVVGDIYCENYCFYNVNNSKIQENEINTYSSLSFDFTEEKTQRKYVLSFEEYINRIDCNYEELNITKTIIKKMSEYYQIRSFSKNISLDGLYNSCYFCNTKNNGG
ncbi:Uncharacterised protein [Campylobacter insulaenigrae]|uniref:hypothetical protein n=1 Tax=Campylobacter insulaenigrae TaxID=260714 RepID=UPI000F6F6245|nr:hypothetical protein [Campylobacter insulaenigrae]MCR6590533.1 hypothetical protein [Campylobacter insulaenigrae]MCR6592070.1 hypothetical protein [Campylobacter insulaenigrae]VEJ53385.1 Uncharacterised protein [Campylobacter insulaenigrae]